MELSNAWWLDLQLLGVAEMVSMVRELLGIRNSDHLGGKCRVKAISRGASCSWRWQFVIAKPSSMGENMWLDI